MALGSEISRVFLLLCGRDLEGFVLFGLGFMWDGMRGIFFCSCFYVGWNQKDFLSCLFLVLCGMDLEGFVLFVFAFM